MKTYLLPIIVLFASCSKVCDVTVTVEKDCTGSYLRYKSQDYKVCNPGVIQDYADGTSFQATFRKINSCKSEDEKIRCMMLHEYESWIKIEEIN